jgi:hypothetical protein
MRAFDNPATVYGSGDNRLLVARDPQPMCPVWDAFIAGLVADVDALQRYLARSILWDTAPGNGWTLFASDFSTLLQKELACFVSCFHPEREPYAWPTALERELSQVFVWVTQGAVKLRSVALARAALPAKDGHLLLVTGSHGYWLRRADVSDSDAAVLEQALTNLLGSPVISQPDLGWLLSAGVEEEKC